MIDVIREFFLVTACTFFGASFWPWYMAHQGIPRDVGIRATFAMFVICLVIAVALALHHGWKYERGVES